MVWRIVDDVEGPLVADDSSLARGVQLARNLEAIADDRPLQAAIAWRSEQRWHAPWPVCYGPIWVGYSETPIEALVVHLAHNGRVSSTGESTPADYEQAVKLHATACGLDGIDRPPPNVADWEGSIAIATAGTYTLTAAPRGRRGLVGVAIWVCSEPAASPSHTLDVYGITATHALIVDPLAAPAITAAAPERSVVMRPSWSDAKGPDEAAGPLYWGEYVLEDVAALSTLHVSPPAAVITDEMTSNTSVDLYPMAVARIRGVLAQATPRYDGPVPEGLAPSQPARAEEGPRAAADWLRDRWAGHWRALSGWSAQDRGVAPWGRRRTLTASYQVLPGDGAVHPGYGPAPIRFRAWIGLVAQRRDEGGTEADGQARVDVRLVVETMPPGASAEAEGTATETRLPAPSLHLAPGPDWRPIRQALGSLQTLGYTATRWSSRGALWPAGGDGTAPVADVDQIAWVECEVVSATGEHPRVIRPEIKSATGPSVGTHVWWVGGVICWRPEVAEDEVYEP
jgi:hypothetical protein